MLHEGKKGANIMQTCSERGVDSLDQASLTVLELDFKIYIEINIGRRRKQSQRVK